MTVKHTKQTSSENHIPKVSRIRRSLAGEWQLVFDPENIGKQEKWAGNLPDGIPSPVPGVWETIRPGYDGVGWLSRQVQIEPEWLDRRIQLVFNAVNYFAEVWWNGHRIGENEGGYHRFSFEITDQVKTGENTLVVRVINPPQNREIEGFRSGAPLNQGNIPVGKAGWYYNFGGIWQDVEVVITDQVKVTDCYVQPFPDQKEAHIHLTLDNGGPAGTYTLFSTLSSDAPSVCKQVRLKPGVNKRTLIVTFDKVHLWSVHDPFLYTLTAGVEGQDAERVRFGMREFSVRDGFFHLNGERIFIKGFLHQGTYPRTLAFPETSEMARFEFERLKEAGCNFLRCHIKPPPREIVELADEMGILIMLEPAIGWIMNSPETEARCARDVLALVKQFRNHASVVFWCLLNEAFAFLGFSIQQVVDMTSRISESARKLDPTRLMIDTSGGHGLGASGGTTDMMLDTAKDLAGLAHLRLPNQDQAVHFVDAHSYCSMPVSDASLENYRTSGREDFLFFVSEYGAAEVPPDYAAVLSRFHPNDQALELEDYRLHLDFYESLKHQFNRADLAELFGDPDGFIEAINRTRADELRLITLALRSNPRLGGMCYCQLADASGELFGALDHWREPKPLWNALKEGFETTTLVPEIDKRVVFQDDEVDISAKLITEDLLQEEMTYAIRLVNGSNRTLRKSEGTVSATNPVETIRDLTFSRRLKPGSYQLKADLKHSQGTATTQTLDFQVVERVPPSVNHVAVKGEKDDLSHYLNELGLQVDKFGNNYREKNIPLLVDCRGDLLNDRYMVSEQFGQIRKMVQLGGCLVLLEPEPLMLFDSFFERTIRPQPVMRTCGYVKPHPIFEGLPSGGVADYVYADVDPHKRWERGDDVLAAGGEVLYGCMSMNMWTRPAAYAWGAGLYTLPLGRGTVVVSQLKIMENLGVSAVADRLLVNLISYAASRIVPGGEHRLLSRCIDPL